MWLSLSTFHVDSSNRGMESLTHLKIFSYPFHRIKDKHGSLQGISHFLNKPKTEGIEI